MAVRISSRKKVYSYILSMTKMWLMYIWWNCGVINSILENQAAYTNKLTSKNLPYDTKLFKCGDSENSPSFKSYGLFYQIKCPLFCIMGNWFHCFQVWYYPTWWQWHDVTQWSLVRTNYILASYGFYVIYTVVDSL